MTRLYLNLKDYESSYCKIRYKYIYKYNNIYIYKVKYSHSLGLTGSWRCFCCSAASLMYLHWVHFLMVHGLIYAVSEKYFFLSFIFMFHVCLCNVNVLIEQKKKTNNQTNIFIMCSFISVGPQIYCIYWSGGCLTLSVFQIMTAGTTVMRQDVVTPAPALSSNATVAAVYRITGPATAITTVATTVTRQTQTAPIRVSGETNYHFRKKQNGYCSFPCQWYLFSLD